MRTGVSAFIFADFEDLRNARLLSMFFPCAPRPQADADYTRFLKETGFDYERDLDRIAIAFVKHGQDSTLFAVVDGKFERQKISDYAVKTGTVTKSGTREILSVPVTDSTKKIAFTFLRNDR